MGMDSETAATNVAVVPDRQSLVTLSVNDTEAMGYYAGAHTGFLVRELEYGVGCMIY